MYAEPQETTLRAKGLYPMTDDQPTRAKHAVLHATTADIALAKAEGIDVAEAVELNKQLLATMTCAWCKRRPAEKHVFTKEKGKKVQKGICLKCLNKSTTTAPIQKVHPKVGRNVRCACGSGLKYKRCHGAKRG